MARGSHSGPFCCSVERFSSLCQIWRLFGLVTELFLEGRLHASVSGGHCSRSEPLPSTPRDQQRSVPLSRASREVRARETETWSPPMVNFSVVQLGFPPSTLSPFLAPHGQQWSRRGLDAAPAPALGLSSLEVRVWVSSVCVNLASPGLTGGGRRRAEEELEPSLR